MPDTKTNIAQDKNTKSVCPMSGCIINSNPVGIIAIIVNKYLI